MSKDKGNKDPAILFYPDLWLTGTHFLSNEQKGKFIDLLCLQHQHGGFIKKCDFEGILPAFHPLNGATVPVNFV